MLWKALSTIICNQIPPNSTLLKIEYVLALKARTDYMFCAGFFHTRKNLKNFSKEVIKSHLAVLIWCGKRDKHFSNHKGKEVRLMKPSDFQKTVQCRFESCLKKVVRSVVKDYYKELNRRKNKEISFSELPDVLVVVLCQYFGHKKSNFFMLHF